MAEIILKLEEGEITLNPDITYNVYGETMFALDLIEQDFEHLAWLDQLTILQDIELTGEISILYHPEVVKSLYDELEASPYWGKDRYEALSVYRRLQTKQVSDEKEERKLLKPVEWTPSMHSKKGKVVSGLVDMGYDRPFARDLVKRFLQEKGDGYMNLTVKTINNHVDQFARDVKTETEGRYIKADSQKPCTIYLVRFTNIASGETFIKPGITTRPLEERFVTDKKHYDIEVLHTAEHKMAECVERENAIKERYKGAYKYMPEKRLSNNGTTECLSSEAPIHDIMVLMGTSKVK